jgi:hypothetical protein
MAPVRSAILRHLAGWDIREFSDLGALQQAGQAAGYFPDLILVSQRYRDEYSAEDVHLGFETFPVARWICVYGPWCESEGRHGSRWPMAVRIPLRFLETRLTTEASVIQGQTPALPLTAARDEVFEFDSAQRLPSAPGEGIAVAVLSPDKELAGWLADLCREAGYVVHSTQDNRPADVLIVDLDPVTPATRELLQRLKQEQPKSRMLGLLGIVLPQDRVSLSGNILVALVSKLTPAAEILRILKEASQGLGTSE